MEKKICSRCDEYKDIELYRKDKSRKSGLDYWCIECRRKYDRERINTPERIESYGKYKNSEKGKEQRRARDRKNYWINRHKIAAKRIIEEMVKSGEINKMPCQVCGNKKSLGHHPDYSKPKEVIWLCHQHHWDAHRGV